VELPLLGTKVLGYDSSSYLVTEACDILMINITDYVCCSLDLYFSHVCEGHCAVRVLTLPEKAWKVLDFSLDFPGLGNSGKISLVLESPRN